MSVPSNSCGSGHMSFAGINYLAVLAAAVAAWLFGAGW
jgi:hypothetical protein